MRLRFKIRRKCWSKTLIRYSIFSSYTCQIYLEKNLRLKYYCKQYQQWNLCKVGMTSLRDPRSSSEMIVIIVNILIIFLHTIVFYWQFRIFCDLIFFFLYCFLTSLLLPSHVSFRSFILHPLPILHRDIQLSVFIIETLSFFDIFIYFILLNCRGCCRTTWHTLRIWSIGLWIRLGNSL